MSIDTIRRVIFTLITICVLASAAFAQPENPEGDPDAVPMTGLGILLGAGALFGVKKLMKKTKD
jgi:hypothetical protein